MADELIIGLMSGTSVDGIDAALVRFTSSSKLTVVATEFTAFSDALRAEINSLAQNNSALTRCEDSALHEKLAHEYAKASLALINNAGVDKSQISAIANHGQTVRHEPNACPAFSLQLGDAQSIANLTGIPTIASFRQADLAHGGQGAPLMPAFHKAIFGLRNNAYVLNIGGIANLTRLGSKVIGFDTGPGNTLMDQWIDKCRNKPYDEQGQWAQSGTPVQKVLDGLLNDPYFSLPYPKSTGTDYFNIEWLETRVADLADHAAENIQASLLRLTSLTIQQGLRQLQASHGQLYVCGGGAQNSALMQDLSELLADFEIGQTDSLGVPADWLEAVGFAWLGYCYLHELPSNLPSVTGAQKSLVLGQRYDPL